jgi:hypothetical protein
MTRTGKLNGMKIVIFEARPIPLAPARPSLAPVWDDPRDVMRRKEAKRAEQRKQNYGYARAATARRMAIQGKPPAEIRKVLAAMDRKRDERAALPMRELGLERGTGL